MRKTILGAAAILALSFSAQTAAQKEIYIPNDMKGMDLNCDTSRWCYARSLMAPDVAIFWEKGFGKDLSKAPDLDGHNMKVDL
jgi:hypothetical protein